MDILSYLTTLIKTHKEVGIPGLGTIYKKKSPGRYDINTHSFLPPSYLLCFTSDLKEQRLLSELISKNQNISVDAATLFIEQFSQNILDELSGHQESDFGDLGTFSTTSGSLTFIPKQDTNLGFDFYGLPKLKNEPDSDQVKVVEEPVQEEIKAVKEEELSKTQEQQAAEELQVTEEQLELENNNADLSDGTEEIEIPQDNTKLPAEEPEKERDEQPVYEEISEVKHIIAIPEVETPPVTDSPLPPIVPPIVPDQPKEPHFTLDYSDTEKTGMPTYLKVIIALAVLAVLGAVAYLARPELFGDIIVTTTQQAVVTNDKTQLIKNNDQARIDSIVRADSIRISNEKAILAADSARDSIAAINPIAVPTAVETEIIYEVIAASLINQKEADKFLADMKARGIPAKVANMPGRRVKISIGTFTDEATAKKELEVLKKTTRIPGIYIYKVKHTNNSK